MSGSAGKSGSRPLAETDDQGFAHPKSAEPPGFGFLEAALNN